jgi:hypothetical protein
MVAVKKLVMTAQQTHQRHRGMQNTTEKNLIYKTEDDLFLP